MLNKNHTDKVSYSYSFFSAPAIALWNEADDDKLQHGGEEEYSELERRYGENAVTARQQFLASYLRSRESL